MGRTGEDAVEANMSLVSRCVKQFQGKCNFSIDHILNVAGEKTKFDSCGGSCDSEEERKFEWLNCTRYRPPKLQRQRKRDGIQRRKLGRNPRIPFSSSQVAFLEAKFVRTPYLSSSDVTQLAANLQLSETRVKIWFQNRRARERRDREGRSKAAEAARDATSQPAAAAAAAAEGGDPSRLENLFLGGCLLPASPERGTRPRELRSDLCNAIRSVHLNEMTNYVQVFAPLDLSDRPLLCK